MGVSRYIKIRNSETEEEVIIDTYMSRYRRLAMGFLNTLKLDPYFVKHITLTQKVENYKPRILDDFRRKLKRFYGDVVFLWTVEAQERGVLHWHLLVGFPYDPEGIFNKSDIDRIQLYWKYGNVDIKPIRKPSMFYLLKYITKSLDVGLELIDYQIKRIGSTRISGYLRQSWTRLLKAIEYFISFQITIDQFNDFYWSNGNAFLHTDNVKYCPIGNNGNYRAYRERLYVYKKPSTSWYRVSEYSTAEAF